MLYIPRAPALSCIAKKPPEGGLVLFEMLALQAQYG